MIFEVLGNKIVNQLMNEKFNMFNLVYVHSESINTNECYVDSVKIYTGENNTDFTYEVHISDIFMSSSSHFYSECSKIIETSLINDNNDFSSMEEVMNDSTFFENHSDFQAKIQLDDSESEFEFENYSFKKTSRKRPNSWIRKKHFKNKLKREFLSINPDMKLDDITGDTPTRCLYLHCFVKNGKYRNPKFEYWLNPYTRRYITKRGNIKKYSGKIAFLRLNFFETISNNRTNLTTITNRKIRYRKIIDTEDVINQYSFFKKLSSENLVEQI